MPAIRIKEDEPAVPLEKAITLRDFLTITRDVDKAMILMRRTCLEGNNVVCATYKDQVGHYLRTLLRLCSTGSREPVGSMLRRMGEPEYASVKDVEVLWEKAKREYPEIANLSEEEGGRAGPEFLEEGLVNAWEERLGEMIGPIRWETVKGIQWGVMGGPPPKKPGIEVEELKEVIEAEEAVLMRMKEELRQKLERMKG